MVAILLSILLSSSFFQSMTTFRQLGEVFSVLRLRQKKSCQTACCRLAIIQRYNFIFTIHCIFYFFRVGENNF